MKRQVSNYILELARSPDLARSISTYVHDALNSFARRRSLRLQRIDTNSTERIKSFLTTVCLKFWRGTYSQTINGIMSSRRAPADRADR